MSVRSIQVRRRVLSEEDKDTLSSIAISELAKGI